MIHDKKLNLFFQKNDNHDKRSILDKIFGRSLSEDSSDVREHEGTGCSCVLCPTIVPTLTKKELKILKYGIKQGSAKGRVDPARVSVRYPG